MWYGKTGLYAASAVVFYWILCKKDGRTLIIGVFDSHRRWDDVKFIIEKHGKINL
jgi:hypothetical protein